MIVQDFISNNELNFRFITEIWLTTYDQSPFPELTLVNYNFFNFPRTVGRGGGIATGFKNTCHQITLSVFPSFGLQVFVRPF